MAHAVSVTCRSTILIALAAISVPGFQAAAGDRDAPAAEAASAPREISIGEPISLPYAAPLAVPPPPPPPGDPRPAGPLPSVVAPAERGPAAQPQATAPAEFGSRDPAAAGNGWLGMAVDDSIVTGRLVVVEVAPNGPAARAGLKPQDMLLAINGTQLRTSDELAAILASISPGQRVKMAVGRDNRVEEVVATAAVRPAESQGREWQSPEPPLAPAAAVSGAPPDFSPPFPKPLPGDGVGIPAMPSTARLSEPAVPPLAAQPLPVPAMNDAVPLAGGPGGRGTAAGRTALGVRTLPVDPTVQQRFQLTDQSGAFVVGVVQDLPASRAGVPPGSVIVAINNQPVRSPQDLTHLVTSGPVGRPVPLHYVLPGGISRQAEVVLQSLELPLERALVGDGALPEAAAPRLEPAPHAARRPPAAGGAATATTAPPTRLEEVLGRVNERLERIERRLERLTPRP